MKKTLSVILSVFLLVGMAGCGSRSAGDDIAGGRGDAAQAVTLSRTETTSVYGVEAPGSDENILLGAGLLAANAPREGQKISSAPQGEVRAVWMSYLTLEPMVKGKTKAQFTANVGAAFKKAADFGFNTVFVQVRPFGDALYASDFFPWSRYLTGTEGQDPGYDPLEIMCALADEEGLRIEAWLNPYRVRIGDQPMSSDNQAKIWLSQGSDAALEWNGGVYYNPGSPAARKLIVNGVREIVQNYDVDGVHFDDYFYPTTDFAFDSATYRASGSNLSQADWRRENVDILIREVYAAIKELKPACLFGISPQGNVKTNYESQFADASVWLSNPGYVDYICPQVYYGYDNATCPYAETVRKWADMIKVDGIKLYVGIGAYKIGTEDTWAGAGRDEWLGTTDLLARMVTTARDAKHYGGVAFYSYESLFVSPGRQMQAEERNLKKIF
ncbi:family 10 glycosylhydrolase [Anaerotruncus massiliensis (ex Liu et al. 2021)]|uniref:family 10 glycosylhydrolase n=1 Tax=Anaerotruncus massiliensis (ex Liu et al. 2021) TaxID=2321404 RepID=UPI003AF64A7E